MTESRRALPEPRSDGPLSLEAAIVHRRSLRRYGSDELSLQELSQLLWSAQGVTGDRASRRAAPSAGGCHPLVLYLCQSDGVWRYHAQGHYLTEHLGKDIRTQVAQAAWGQGFIAEAPTVFAISAVFVRTTERYGERGERRYLPMDAGHAAENLLLQAVALGLGGVPVGAFDDASVKRVLSLPGTEEPLYLIPVGHPRER